MFIGDDFIPDWDCETEEEELEAYHLALIEEQRFKEKNYLYDEEDPYADEEWRPIPGYEGLYEVSNKGRVKSLEREVYISSEKAPIHKKEKILKEYINPKEGYPMYSLCKNGKIQLCMGHRLVAKAFVPNPENKPYVDHINTIRNDNIPENLEWVTHKENQNNDLTKMHLSIANTGRKCYYKRVVSEEEKERIRERFKNIPLSEEHKKKLSEAHKGKKLSKESIEKMLLTNHLNGRIHLDEDENGNLIYSNGLIEPKKYLI